MSLSLRKLRFAFQQARRTVTGWAHGMRRARTGEPRRFPTADYSLHMLLCHRDVDMGLWCLKSFSHFTDASAPITIHDDGSLTSGDRELLERQLFQCRVIGRAEADAKLNSLLSGHPRSRQMRELRRFVCSLKLFDPWVYATTERIVVVDSDILFFRRPTQLIDCANGGSACFGSDYVDRYAVDRDLLHREFDVEVLPMVNAGLIALGRSDFDLDFAEAYFTRFSDSVSDPNRHEQTLYALLMSRIGAVRLDPAYQISAQPIGEKTVSHHFVNDGSRIHFSARGLHTFRDRGILDVIAGTRP